MVYSSKFVLCILVNGRPQKELANGTVSLPFGATYSLRFRNKNNRRAVVKFYIDSENVSGEGYIVPANDYVDIERHHDKDRQFKFVSLESEEAVDFGKNGPNEDKSKGVIEARFYLEKERPQPKIVEEHHHHHYPRPIRSYPIVPYPRMRPYDGYNYGSKGITGSPGGISGASGKFTCSTNDAGITPLVDFNDAAPQQTNTTRSLRERKKTLEEGCTVEGDVSGQRFHSVHIDIEEDYVALKIVLMGYEGDVQEAVITRTDASFCENCGARKAKASAKFCCTCGHKL